MVYDRDFTFFGSDSGSTSEIYYNDPHPISAMEIQVSGQGTINLTVQGRNGAQESWIPVSCIAHTAAGLSVVAAITAAGLYSPLMLPKQIRMVNAGTPGSVHAYAQIKEG